jgi:hypothetical protein
LDQTEPFPRLDDSKPNVIASFEASCLKPQFKRLVYKVATILLILPEAIFIDVETNKFPI